MILIARIEILDDEAAHFERNFELIVKHLCPFHKNQLLDILYTASSCFLSDVIQLVDIRITDHMYHIIASPPSNHP